MAEKIRLALAFKDLAVWLKSSCTGLNVAGYAAAEVLRENGIDVTVFPVRHNVDLVNQIDKYNESHEERLTHVVISAPWLTIFDLKAILTTYPDIQFVVMSHSNVGFLQADPDGINLLRLYSCLAKEYPNIRVGGNSSKFVRWFSRAYDKDVVLLPNLYPLVNRSCDKIDDDIVRIGAFGAVRPYKNFMTAAAACLLIQKELDCPVEFHMSHGGEGDGWQTGPAIEQIFRDTDVKLVTHDWMYWDKFIQIVGSMDLLIQVSYTESFNMITADGIVSGVPSVVSPAIYWVPSAWKADPDDAQDVARTGLKLLEEGSLEGLQALKAHNQYALKYWFDFLDIEKPLDRFKRWLGF